MKVRIDEVHAHGNVAEERVFLTVLEDCNLKYYMVMDTTYVGTSISNEHRHIKWLSPCDAKRGERICLFTKKGTYAKEVRSGVTWHNLYWGSGSPIWNNTGDAAVLLELSDWKATKAKV